MGIRVRALRLAGSHTFSVYLGELVLNQLVTLLSCNVSTDALV